MRVLTRAAVPDGTAIAGAVVQAPELARLRILAEHAVAEPGTSPLQPTGAVRDALAAGRLLRTGDPARLDALENVLRTGTIDRSTAHVVGKGANGDRSRYVIEGPDASRLLAVEKPVNAQAAQEEFAWKLGRELGIDHLLPAVARRSNGDAMIEFRRGASLAETGRMTERDLDVALATSYLADARLHVSPAEAAQAARIDGQLVRFVDYLVANNDRHRNNTLVDDVVSGDVSFLDFGMMSRGALAEGGSELRPTMRQFQAQDATPHVDLDPAVVTYIRERLTPARIEALHAEVFAAAGGSRPTPGSLGERLHIWAKSTSFREGMQHRLDHVLGTGGFDYAVTHGDELLEPKIPVDNRANARGLGNVRAAFLDAEGGGFW